jgi:glycosyltransferase involved in cell wall biosynthesis
MRMFFGASIRRADQIVSNSLGTARRFEAAYQRRIAEIVRPGLTATIRPTIPGEVAALLRRHGIERPYLLTVGTLEPRKGLHLLVPAFLSLLEAGQLRDQSLVVAGERGWKDDPISRMVGSSERIRPLGFVSDELLSALYTGADVFVCPSSYEGFGMPVLEARACGARVVATDIPELREAGGEDAIYIPPTVEGIRQGILKALLSDPPKPLNRADYSWVKSATVFARVLTESGNTPMAKSA